VRFSVTFEVVTPESAENGEADSSGYAIEGASLREALDALGCGEGGVEANEYPIEDPRWITAHDVERATGETENRSLHFPDSVTPSTKIRICRLLGVYGVDHRPGLRHDPIRV
jgi:hypothetical protein